MVVPSLRETACLEQDFGLKYNLDLKWNAYCNPSLNMFIIWYLNILAVL